VVPDQYALGPGDGLTINLWGEYDETFETRVTPDGKISLPTIGDLTLKGLTLTAAQKLIDGEVKKYYRNVKSGLSLTSLRVFEIGVLGEVLQPGSYLATPVKHVSDVIAQAGGILPGGSQRRVQLHRNGQVVAIADLTAFLRHGDESLNPFLQDGDKVIVPPIGDQRVTVYASEVSTGAPGVAGGGAVTENVIPNVVEIKEGERLSTVISEVGGVSPWWDLESVFIQRTIKVPDGTMQIPVNLRQYVVENDESQNPVLIKGDEVYFPAVVRRVLIAGSVKAPAAYPYLPGKSADAYLMQAGGPTIVADLGRSFIQRADGRVEPYSATAELNNGDSIIVLEKFFKTWQDYFALVGTISGVILGLVGFYAAFTNFGR
jgi:protein involved in polysaccharide export with SLBB domain